MPITDVVSVFDCRMLALRAKPQGVPDPVRGRVAAPGRLAPGVLKSLINPD